MLDIIDKQKFVTTPWKNGKGVTTELAINKGGSLSDFDWRISIASVSENGAFSDFSGVERNLFLVAGAGISLTHELDGVSKTDELTQLLDYSCFDGASNTTGTLLDGEIFDLNLMTRQGKYDIELYCCSEKQTLTLSGECANAQEIFVFAPDFTEHQQKKSALLVKLGHSTIELERGNLCRVVDEPLRSVAGELFLVIKLVERG